MASDVRSRTIKLVKPLRILSWYRDQPLRKFHVILHVKNIWNWNIFTYRISDSHVNVFRNFTYETMLLHANI